MSKLKTAPAPWVRGRGGRIEDASGHTVEATGLALVTGYRDEADPAFANADLIAAAPELYECLSHVANVIELANNGHPVPDNHDGEQWLERTLAALAKARGKHD